MAKVKLLDPSDARRRLDRYELIGELASGGMATVFLARNAGVGGFQRFVAIKRLHPHLASEEEFIEMFLDEARLAAGIHHQHVVPILEVGQSESGYYLVMEYIEGDTLARIVARALTAGKPVPQAILLRVMIDGLAGLHAAHELTDGHGRLVHLVHRDCSPQNILVGADGCSRLTDFGVARASSRLSHTGVDRVKGKLAYMSPEQARGNVEVDRRSDVFAMGVILWEVLAGRRLFKAESEAATLSRLLIDPIPRLSSALPGVHAAIDDVCAKALARDANKRFPTAAAMADALEGAARVAAGSLGDAGVASPREVAAYMQGALGQDIAAQRESVRAWLSQSGSNLPGATPPPYDVTMKLPLDVPRVVRATPAPVALAEPPAPVPYAASADDDLSASDDDLDQDTLLMDRSEVIAAGGRPEPRSLAAARAALNSASNAASSEASLRASAPRASWPAPAHPGDRSGVTPARPRPRATTHQPTPLAATALRPVSAPSRKPQLVVIAVGAFLVLAGFALWTRNRVVASDDGALPPPRASASSSMLRGAAPSATVAPVVASSPVVPASAPTSPSAARPPPLRTTPRPSVGTAPSAPKPAVPEPPPPVPQKPPDVPERPPPSDFENPSH